MARFEAVYHEEEPNERCAEWCVVEWTETNPETGWRGGRTVAKFGGGWASEEAAVELARTLQEEYNQEFHAEFG